MAGDETTGRTETTGPAATAVTARHGAGIDRTEEWDAAARPATCAPRPTARRRRRGACTTSPSCSSDVERTIAFYQDLLELPLTELFENRDYQGSTHFFFDIGNGNSLAFFDFPGLDLGPYAEGLGGLHHLAISVEPERWHAPEGQARRRWACPSTSEGGTSLYFQGPDGERIELIADPLGEMYGSPVV